MARFSLDEIEKIKSVKVFLSICATGKTYLASMDSRFVDIDKEEAMYKFDYDKYMSYEELSKLQGHGVVVRKDSEDFIHKKLIEHIKNGRLVLSATHRHILRFLAEEKIPYVIFQYPASDVQSFWQRMRARGNSEDFIERMLEHREEAYCKHKKDENAVAVLDIYKDEYLSDLLWEVFGKPQK